MIAEVVELLSSLNQSFDETVLKLRIAIYREDLDFQNNHIHENRDCVSE